MILGSAIILLLLVVLWPVLRLFAYVAAGLWTLLIIAPPNQYDLDDDLVVLSLAMAPWLLLVLAYLTRAGMGIR